MMTEPSDGSIQRMSAPLFLLAPAPTADRISRLIHMHSRTWTWGVIAVSTYATAFLSAITAIATLHLSLPATDLASDDPFFLLLFDPFVFVVAVPLALGGATIVLPFAIWSLQGTKLDKSIPRVGLATIIGAALTGPGHFILAFPLTILLGVAAMLWVRSKPQYKLGGI